MSGKWIVPLTTAVASFLSAFLGAYLAVAVSLERATATAGSANATLSPLSGPTDSQLTGGPLELQPAETPKDAASNVVLSEPGRLPPSVPASSLKRSSHSSTPSSALRSVVEQELPDAEPDEVDIWSQQLEDLSPDAAREILRLRRALAEPNRLPEGTSDSSSPAPGKQVRFIDLQ